MLVAPEMGTVGQATPRASVSASRVGQVGVEPTDQPEEGAETKRKSSWTPSGSEPSPTS